MSKELRELLNQLETMKAEVRSLMADNKVDEAEKRMEDVRALQKKIKLQQELEEQEAREQRPGKQSDGAEKREQESEAEYRAAFLAGLRGRNITPEQRELITIRTMQAGVGEDGGLIVPQDISTQIRELKRAMIDLSQYVNVEPVSTLSGSRVIEKESDITPLTQIDELANIGELTNPKFVPLTYAVKTYAGILPISNTLLNDTDQNLLAYIRRWIAKKDVKTTNKLIIDLVNTMTKVAVADTDDIKDILNVTLDAQLALTAVVLTNQDGFNYLDKLKDSDGRYLLQPDPTQPDRKMLFGKPVVIAPNKDLPSDTTVGIKAPVIIGDLRELITLFDRNIYEILTTNIGGQAFLRNTTDMRVIVRYDAKLVDDKAAVFGQLTVA